MKTLSKNKPSGPSIWEKSLWDFAVHVYSQPEMEGMCMELQDSYGANVNVMLWCLWLESEDVKVPPASLDEVLAMVSQINQSTVTSLRQVRRQIGVSESFTRVQIESVCKHILNAELMIEKILLHRMQDFTQRVIDTGRVENAPAPLLEPYLEQLGVPNVGSYATTLSRFCLSGVC